LNLRKNLSKLGASKRAPTLLMNKMFFIALILALPCCRSALINTAIRDPVVETTSSIRQFQESNAFSTQSSLILKGDTSTAEINLMSCLTVGYYIFDSSGNHLCYGGKATCEGIQFRQLLKGQSDSFLRCLTDSLSISKVLENARDLNEHDQTFDSFPKSEYYIVTYWARFFGGEKGYRENVKWVEDEINRDENIKKRVTFIKINTDLQESWGLIAGERVKLNFRMKGKSGTLVLGKLPIKR